MSLMQLFNFFEFISFFFITIFFKVSTTTTEADALWGRRWWWSSPQRGGQPTIGIKSNQHVILDLEQTICVSVWTYQSILGIIALPNPSTSGLGRAPPALPSRIAQRPRGTLVQDSRTYGVGRTRGQDAVRIRRRGD